MEVTEVQRLHARFWRNETRATRKRAMRASARDYRAWCRLPRLPCPNARPLAGRARRAREHATDTVVSGPRPAPATKEVARTPASLVTQSPLLLLRLISRRELARAGCAARAAWVVRKERSRLFAWLQGCAAAPRWPKLCSGGGARATVRREPRAVAGRLSRCQGDEFAHARQPKAS